MGKEFCQCEYPGVCVYEKYRWEEKHPLPANDHVVAVFPCAVGAGVIVQWADTDSADPGTTLTLSRATQSPVSGVVLQTYPDQQLAYLLITKRLAILPAGKPVTIHREHNVFGRDAAYLTNVTGQTVAILADTDLLSSLAALANGLKHQGAVVQLSALNVRWPDPKPDLLLFISRSKEELCRALKRLPFGNKSHSAFWFMT
jgi:hypothetical protein